MQKSPFFNLVLTISLVVFFLSHTSGRITGTNRGEPNFLILIADDAGMDIGCYGNPYVKTPNIDQLAKTGIICENTFLTSPQCSPSRISILSGQYPHTTRTEDLHTPLPEGTNFITTYLKQEGYFTGSNGKTHWGPNGNRQFDWYQKEFNTFESFLKEAKGKSFFFWTGFFDPHRPYQKNTIGTSHTPDRVVVRDHLVDDERTRKDIALYYDEISRMDSVAGTYIEILRQEKLLQDTYIIFLSDNGAPFPREKGTLYDTGIQTPFIVSGPGVPQDEIYGGLMSVIDLAPTILELAGIDKPDDMPGMSFSPLLNGDFVIAPEFVFSERNWHDCDEHMRSIRTDQYKLILNAYTEKPHGTAADLANSLSWFSLLDKKAKGELSGEQGLIFTVPRPSVELYDLSKDPGEYNNLAFDPGYRQTAAYLLDELQKWMQETDDFPSTYRTRRDHTDRITGIRYYFQNPELDNDLPQNDSIPPILNE
jgi:arylsulfatase A-like enzyme